GHPFRGQLGGLQLHVLKIHVGEDIVSKIVQVSKITGKAVCVLSVFGAVQDCYLLHSAVILNHKGPLEIIRVPGFGYIQLFRLSSYSILLIHEPVDTINSFINIIANLIFGYGQQGNEVLNSSNVFNVLRGTTFLSLDDGVAWVNFTSIIVPIEENDPSFSHATSAMVKYHIIFLNAVSETFFFSLPLPYKSQLQICAQKRGKLLPSYRLIRGGSLGAPLFKLEVAIDGQTFESLEYCHTIKEAETVAAKVALMSLPQEANPTQQLP
ncbi:hypothetical protein ACJX0J_041586, partial [Zea mays]